MYFLSSWNLISTEKIAIIILCATYKPILKSIAIFIRIKVLKQALLRNQKCFFRYFPNASLMLIFLHTTNPRIRGDSLYHFHKFWICHGTVQNKNLTVP